MSVCVARAEPSRIPAHASLMVFFCDGVVVAAGVGSRARALIVRMDGLIGALPKMVSRVSSVLAAAAEVDRVVGLRSADVVGGDHGAISGTIGGTLTSGTIA